MQHGWEWYDMSFVTCWNASGHLTLLCFDMPAKSQTAIQSVLSSQSVDTTCPYAVFATISEELLQLYDNSVWSIRNHISLWEAASLALRVCLPTVQMLRQSRGGHKRQTTSSCMKLHGTACMSVRR
jgi:hypothetical protein